jgi:hypothetical protein
MIAQNTPLLNNPGNSMFGGGGQNNAGNNNAAPGGRFMFIKDLEPNQKAISLHAIVLDIAKPNQTKEGHEVRNIRIADKTYLFFANL